MTVTLELLFPHLDDLIQTPADVQRLNEAILQLAVQGKLVPQDPQEEPAEELLKRIAAEKEQLVQEGRTTSSKLLPLIDKSKMPFVVPQGWIWCWLADVSDIEMGQSPPGNSYNSTGDGVPLINGPVEFSAGPFGMTLKDKFTTAPTKMCREGDLLVCVRGSTTGRTNVAAFDACIGRGVAAIRSYCFQRYLNYFILKYRQEIYDRGTGTTFPSISQNELLTLPFPLPPLAEQKRIVAKVDELFAQTRALEAKLRRAQEAIVVVNRAVLHHLHHAADPATFQHAAQILGDHFDLLYTDPRPVTDLRQTILQLAVQGKLVATPTSEMLAQSDIDEILTQRISLSPSAKDKSIISEELKTVKEQLHDNPVAFIQVSARCICDHITKGTTPSADELQPTGEIPYLKVYNIRNNEIDFAYNPAYISRKIHENALARSKVYPGDVLMNIVGPPLGKVAIVPDDFDEWNINQALAIFRPVPFIDRRFLYLVLCCQSTLEDVMMDTRGTAGQDNLSLEQCRDIKVPLYSPLYQKRIVAKVDELLARCAALERKLGQAQVAGRQLTAAVLHGAVVE